jgi:GxxExxY protein
MQKTKEEIERTAQSLMDAIVTVHRALGPGLSEKTYQACLAYEVRSRGIEVGCQVDLPIVCPWLPFP